MSEGCDIVEFMSEDPYNSARFGSKHADTTRQARIRFVLGSERSMSFADACKLARLVHDRDKLNELWRRMRADNKLKLRPAMDALL